MQVKLKTKMSLRTLLLMVFCNVIWSFHPLFGKFALESFSPHETAWLRYGSAALTYFVAMQFFKRGTPQIVHPRTSRELILLLILGLAPFTFSPILQLMGLSQAQSIDNALVIAMEPIMAVFLAWIFLKEKLSPIQWISFMVAMIGFGMLARFDFHSFSSLQNAQVLPFLMMLMALWGEASYSVIGRVLTKKYEPEPLYGTAIWVGFTALTLFVLTRGGFPSFAGVRLKSILAILWLGPLGTTLTYMIWMREIRHAPVATLAITLFIQPLAGTWIGIFFLNERLELLQWLGAALILTGVGIQAHGEIFSRKKLAG